MGELGGGTHRASVHQPVRLLLAVQREPVRLVPLLPGPEKPQATLQARKMLHLLLTDGPPSRWSPFPMGPIPDHSPHLPR